MSKATILMIEDNRDILRANAAVLRMEGYRVLEAGTLREGCTLLQQEAPDLILLDVLLPDGNGLDYCRDVLGEDAPRIIFLSALDAPEDVIAGLRAGGDDYMTKPYLIQELVARVEAILRRPAKMLSPQALCIGSLRLNPTAGRAYLCGEDLLLTHREYAILEYLARNTDRCISAETLYQGLWDMKSRGDVRTVWEHISRLRKKMSAAGEVSIELVRGKGYRLVTK